MTGRRERRKCRVFSDLKSGHPSTGLDDDNKFVKRPLCSNCVYIMTKRDKTIRHLLIQVQLKLWITSSVKLLSD